MRIYEKYLPKKWGFVDDLKKCIGKTIEEVEVLPMPYGCTWSHAWAVKFTDGSRAFFAGKPGTGVVIPDRQELEKSYIFRPEEVAEVLATEMKEREQFRKAEANKKREQYERLKEELGL